VTLVVHALVLINIDSNMHGDEIKVALSVRDGVSDPCGKCPVENVISSDSSFLKFSSFVCLFIFS